MVPVYSSTRLGREALSAFWIAYGRKDEKRAWAKYDWGILQARLRRMAHGPDKDMEDGLRKAAGLT